MQGVACVSVEVEARAARDHDPLPGASAVEQAFQQVPPAPILVDLVEDPEARLREVAGEDPRAVGVDVPVEVAQAATQRFRERRLADLPRAVDEGHLRGEVPTNGGGQVASGGEAHGDGRSVHPSRMTYDILDGCLNCHTMVGRSRGASPAPFTPGEGSSARSSRRWASGVSAETNHISNAETRTIGTTGSRPSTDRPARRANEHVLSRQRPHGRGLTRRRGRDDRIEGGDPEHPDRDPQRRGEGAPLRAAAPEERGDEQRRERREAGEGVLDREREDALGQRAARSRRPRSSRRSRRPCRCGPARPRRSARLPS